MTTMGSVVISRGIVAPLSLGEQNRLILENMDLVGRIAANFRDEKGIPFDDLCAAGRVGLVNAARKWAGWGQFKKYAKESIKNAIIDYRNRWEEFSRLPDDDELDRDFYEWKNWGAVAPFEYWIGLSATPEEIVIAFDEFSKNRTFLDNALRFLDKRRRSIIEARFFRKPAQSFQSIARDHKMSYWAVIWSIRGAIAELRENIGAQLNARR